MIPVRLTLQGINSYQETQEIDFTRLSEAGLFGIFGKVGAGKSTILDAISYALFEKTERLDHTGKNYNFTNLRSKRLLIDYECLIDGLPYRFVVKGRRNKNDFEKVEFDRSILTKTETGEWQPVATTTEDLTGITYDNFKRMVIIPQGRFQEFLELGDKDRTRMLMDLFRLERFDLSDRVGVLSARNREALSALNAQLDALGEATPEALQARRDELAANQVELKTHEAECKARTAEEQALDALRLKLDALEAAEAARDALAAQQQTYQQRERRLNEFEYATRHFRSLLDLRKTTRADCARDTQRLADEQRLLTETTAQLTADEARLATLRPAYEARETLLKRAADLRLLREVRELTATLERQAERIERGRKLLEEKTRALDDLRQDREGRIQNLKLQKRELPDLPRLAAAKAWFSRKTELLNEKLRLRADADRKAAEARAAYETHLLLPDEPTLRSHFPPAFDFQKTYAEWETVFLSGRERFNDLIQTVQTERLRLSTRSELQRYAARLVPGEPCPLCQSVHHDGPVHHLSDFAPQLSDLAERVRLLEEQRESLTQVQTHLLSFDGEKRRIRQEWERVDTTLKTHLAAFDWPEFSPDEPKAVDEALTNAGAVQAAIQRAEIALETVEKTIRATEVELSEKVEKPLAELTQRQVRDEATRAEKQRQLTRLTEADVADVPTEALLAEAARLEAEHDSLTREFEGLQKTIQKSEVEQGSRRGVIQTLETQVATYRAKLTDLDTRLAEALNQSAFASLDAVGAVLDQPLDPDAERRAIDAFRAELAAADGHRARLRAETSEQAYHPDLHAALKAEIGALQEKIDRLKGEAGKLVNQIQEIEKQLSNRADLLRQKDALDARQADLNTLTRLFKASGFVNYVSAVYLQNLCNAANERFARMTRQQFRLEVYESRPSTYDFRIRDLLNEGKTRSVGSLSGGQKFQASLALALALSDTQPFFFLDEGFGSLDKESLAIVFDTLKSLRREARVVGVISHVEELQQEIDCYLHVSHDEERGSWVKGSWEI
jgi:exonuclease SbcC